MKLNDDRKELPKKIDDKMLHNSYDCDRLMIVFLLFLEYLLFVPSFIIYFLMKKKDQLLGGVLVCL